ncbi:AraC family transcriptional regulator [Paenibacillus sp. FSL H8-0034]|uniref:AraC family transcriptional regulator n=1 Tax=Paenibacillus sp. FSL H8-0034 TaxID=2954671 RepID=UPI0030FA1B68
MLWNQATIKVMDVRYMKMMLGDELRSYRLPASAFLQPTCGTAMVSLDGTAYQMKPLHVLHGGKGMHMDIVQMEGNFEYYLVFYQAAIPLPCRQEIQQLLERNNPFHIQYGFEPHSPVPLLLRIERMEREWKQSNMLERFHVKTLFYQFVYDLLSQLGMQDDSLKKADLVTQAVWYMNEHYSDTITLESLAKLFGCSPRHLSRLFQDQLGHSPLDYLIRIRMDIAKQLIWTTDATIQEIADGVGYEDRYYFSRLFKKHIGISPNHYKTQSERRFRLNHPLAVSGSSIGASRVQRYIGNELDNHYQYIRKGVLPMNRSWKKPSMAVNLLLMLALLLSACSSAASPSPTKGSSQVPSNSVSAPASSGNGQTAQTGTSRQIVDDRGETVVFSKPAKTILTFPKPLAETAIAIAGDIDRVVGIHPASKSMIAQRVLNKYYPSIKQINSSFTVEGGFVPNIEEVLNIKPDVVFQWNMGKPEYYESMVKAGIQVLTIGWGPWEKEVATIRMLGAALGKEERVEQLLANQDAARTDIEKIVKDIPEEKRVKMLLISAMDGNKISVHGDSNFYHGVPGVKNAAFEEGVSKNTMQVNVEQLLAWNPDMIVIHEAAVGVNPATIYEHPQLKELNAVKNKTVYKLPEFALMSHMASLTWYWYGALAYPDKFSTLKIRDIITEGYKFSYNISLTDEEVNQVLKMDANKDSKDYMSKFIKK